MNFSSSSRNEDVEKYTRTENMTELEEDFEISKTVIQIDKIPDFRQNDFQLMQDLGIEPKKPKWEDLNEMQLNLNLALLKP